MREIRPANRSALRAIIGPVSDACSIQSMIASKRDGLALSYREIEAAVLGFTRGRVSEGQMAALLMAVVLRGMSARETADLTTAMLKSGERLDLSSVPGIKVDKHSTGGVGDKTTLVVAPLVASFGVPVPKMSGRALGHTGGTIDKLECIPGLRTDLSAEQFRQQVGAIGVAIAAQTAEMVPADKKIYALRDATATVESIPLIASSVMSKKLAAGADAIVLDVKAGNGALVRDLAAARELAAAMVEIGAQLGKKTVALVTRMEEPLGHAVGDCVELAEAVSTLKGAGPPDFAELCELVAGHMLVLGGVVRSQEEGEAVARQGLRSGAGLGKLRQLVEAQRGDVAVLDEPETMLRQAELRPVTAERKGYVTGVDARRVGWAVRALKEATGAHKRICGVILHAKTGDRAAVGEPLATVLGARSSGAALDTATGEIAAAYRLGDTPPPSSKLLVDVLGA